MPHRSKSSILDEVFETLLDMPAWLGLAIPAGAYALARWIVPWLLTPENDTAPTAVICRRLGDISVQIAPYVGLALLGVWGIAQVVRFTRRRERED